MSRLGGEGAAVEFVAEEAEGEDSDGEGVAAVVCVAAGKFGEGFVAVFGAGGGVPEGWVEDDHAGRSYGSMLVWAEQDGDVVIDIPQKLGWLKSTRPAILSVLYWLPTMGVAVL